MPSYSPRASPPFSARPPSLFFPCPPGSPNHRREFLPARFLAALSASSSFRVCLRRASVRRPTACPSVHGYRFQSSSRRFAGFFVHDNCSESGFLFSLSLFSAPLTPIASLNRRNYPRITTVPPHRPPGNRYSSSSPPFPFRISLSRVSISFPRRMEISKMPFMFIYYSERKKRKERLLRKEERKELGRGRVSSDPQRSGGETKTNIDTAQEDARRERALQHVRTLRFAQGARGRNMGRAERRRKRKERRKRTRSPFVAGSHNGDRRASGQSLMQSIYVYCGCCVFVRYGTRRFQPHGTG